MKSKLQKRVVQRMFICAIALSVIGCGKAEYEAKMRTRVDTLAFASKFLEGLYQEPQSVIRDVVDLRLPKAFPEDTPTLTRGKKNRRGEAIKPGRIEPPFARIPGFKYSYERFINLGDRNDFHPIYCYFGSVPVGEKKRSTILAEIKSQTGKKFKGATWTDESLDTPDGQKVPVKKLSVKGAQSFDTDPDGGDPKKLPGQFDVYVYSSPQNHIIIGFRTTEKADEITSLFTNGGLSVGTIKIPEALADEPAGS